MRFILGLACVSGFVGTVGCGGGSTGTSEIIMADGSQKAQYVVSRLQVPPTEKDFAIDLNGDGRIDNQLGSIISVLASEGLNAQSSMDSAVNNGDVLILVDQLSDDPNFSNDAASEIGVSVGMKTTPDFSGKGVFTVNSDDPRAPFYGKIVDDKFNSNAPSTSKHPTQVTLNLPFIPNAAPVALVLNGAHAQFSRNSDGTIAQTCGATGNLACGSLQGAIKMEDVQNRIIPSIATYLNTRIGPNPTDSSNKQILSLFDTGGTANAACNGTCKNPDAGDRPGQCAVVGDNIVDSCEVGTSQIVMGVLNADVQMFDDSGNYAPNPKNTKKDSISLGIGFTAVPATF